MPPITHKRRKLSPQSTQVLYRGASDEDEKSEESSPKDEDARRDAPRSNPKASRVGRGAIALGNGAYNTNLFQLQLNELLSKVRPDYERRMDKADNALRKLKDIIERIPNREAKSVSKALHPAGVVL